MSALTRLLSMALLALLWCASTEEFAPFNIAVGCVLGLIIPWALARASRDRDVETRLPTSQHPAPTPTSPTTPPTTTPPQPIAHTLSRLPRATLAAGALLLYFIRELVIANIQMARFTLSPLRALSPGIVAVPLEPMSDLEILLIANLITLTPGTLSVDVSRDRRTLYIHTMSVTTTDADDFRASIKNGFERRVLEVTR
jgi:multicomponent Na+:H+ antiporter subunit E